MDITVRYISGIVPIGFRIVWHGFGVFWFNEKGYQAKTYEPGICAPALFGAVKVQN